MLFKDTLNYSSYDTDDVKIPLLGAAYFSKISHDTIFLSLTKIESYKHRFEFYKENGLLYVSYSPQQNGVAEFAMRGTYNLIGTEFDISIEVPDNLKTMSGKYKIVDGKIPEKFTLKKIN